jgi:hypothetical protein
MQPLRSQIPGFALASIVAVLVLSPAAGQTLQQQLRNEAERAIVDSFRNLLRSPANSPASPAPASPDDSRRPAETAPAAANGRTITAERYTGPEVDVIGIRLGATEAEVRRVLEQQELPLVLSQDLLAAPGDPERQFLSVLSGRASGGSSIEGIEVRVEFSPPSRNGSGQAIFVQRWVKFAPDRRPSLNAVLDGLRAKYGDGEDVVSRGRGEVRQTYAWSPGGEPRKGSNRGGCLEDYAFAGAPVSWTSDPTKLYWRSIERGCARAVLVQIQLQDGAVDALRTAAVDFLLSLQENRESFASLQHYNARERRQAGERAAAQPPPRQ